MKLVMTTCASNTVHC